MKKIMILLAFLLAHNSYALKLEEAKTGLPPNSITLLKRF